MKRIVLFLFLLTTSPLHAQLYHAGEILDYRVSYRAKLVPNTEMATARLATTTVYVGNEPVYKVTGEGKTLAAFKLFMRVDDRYTIRADQQTLQTRSFESDIHEGSYTFRSSYTYDWGAMKVYTRWKSRRMAEEQQKTIPLTPTSMDPLSLFYRLRGTIDRHTLRAGETRTLEMLLEDTIRRLRFRFLGREQKRIRRLGTFNTLKFSCQLGTSEGFSFEDGSEFLIWVSDDENRIPLYLESPVRVGSVQAYLSDYRGLKYPLSSLVEK